MSKKKRTKALYAAGLSFLFIVILNFASLAIGKIANVEVQVGNEKVIMTQRTSGFPLSILEVTQENPNITPHNVELYERNLLLNQLFYLVISLPISFYFVNRTRRE